MRDDDVVRDGITTFQGLEYINESIFFYLVSLLRGSVWKGSL